MQADVLIKVRHDGSGTIVSRVTVSKTQFEAMSQVTEAAGTFSEESARENAVSYGPGVEFVSYRQIDEDELAGMEATYSFQTIGALAIAPVNMAPGQEDTGERIFFTFTREEGNRVAISLPPDPEPDAETQESSEAELDMALGMMKSMTAGLKVRMALEVEDGFTWTNTQNVNGNVVTILEFDFDEITADENNLREYVKVSETPSKARGLAGVTYPENNPIVVEFGDSGGGFGSTTLMIIGGGVLLLLVFLLTSVRIRT
jgi:hypothetical protein